MLQAQGLLRVTQHQFCGGKITYRDVGVGAIGTAQLHCQRVRLQLQVARFVEFALVVERAGQRA